MFGDEAGQAEPVGTAILDGRPLGGGYRVEEAFAGFLVPSPDVPEGVAPPLSLGASGVAGEHLVAPSCGSSWPQLMPGGGWHLYTTH